MSTVIRVEATGERLRVTFPLHVARRNGLEAGAEVVVSLLREGIHLMRRTELVTCLFASMSGTGSQENLTPVQNRPKISRGRSR